MELWVSNCVHYGDVFFLPCILEPKTHKGEVECLETVPSFMSQQCILRSEIFNIAQTETRTGSVSAWCVLGKFISTEIIGIDAPEE